MRNQIAALSEDSLLGRLEDVGSGLIDCKCFWVILNIMFFVVFN